jgi:hypothetical protein
MSDPQRAVHEEEDLVPEDDAVIGRAFNVSLVILGAIAVVVLAVFLIGGSDEEPPPQKGPTIGPPAATVKAVDAPRVRFTDVTKQAGIDFLHVNGAAGGRYLPETMGSGCAFFDPDGDGDQDLLLVNATSWPWTATERRAPPSSTVLLRNDGKGSFERVRDAGFVEGHYGMGAACGDYDGDGDVDVFVTGVGECRLYRNDGGRFTDVSDAAGVRGPKGAWTTSAGFCDLDGDGDLDLFVCNYVKWTKAIDEGQNYTLEGVGRAYGPPTSFEGTHGFLYRNEGDGTFIDVSEDAGLHVTNPATGVPVGKALGLCFADFTGDGRIDVFVANDTVRNFLFENEATDTLRFREIGERMGVAYDGRGAATGAMGTDVGDVRPGIPVIAVGNFASETSSFYQMNLPNGTDAGIYFTDDSVAEGIGAASRKALSFGLFFFDYDLDGRLDLFQTNGHLEQEINKVQPSQHYEQPSQLFWNAGPKARSAYALVDPETVGDLSHPVVGRGCSYADIDGDGDLDVLITQCGRSPLLLRNDQDLGHHWVRVVLDDAKGSPIGARVALVADGVKQVRTVMPTRSYLSQVELPVTFGLGEAERVETLEVTWPDGGVTRVEVPSVDREIRVSR